MMTLDANPVVKGIIAVASLVAIFYAAESHFATAGDIAALTRSIGTAQLRNEIWQLEQWRNDAENRMLDAKEPAAKRRYELQAQRLQAEKLAKQRRLDEITTGKQ